MQIVLLSYDLVELGTNAHLDGGGLEMSPESVFVVRAIFINEVLDTLIVTTL